MDDKTKSSETSIEEDISGEITTSNLVESSSDKFKVAKLKSKGRKLFQSLYSDNSEADRKFKIDDDELSSGKIAQHFQPKPTDEYAKENVNEPKIDQKKSNTVSKKATDETSLSQNTTNDISDIADEESRTDDREQIKVKSLELNYKENISLEERGCRSLDTVIKIANIQRNEEKVEEIMDLITREDSKSLDVTDDVKDGTRTDKILPKVLSLSKGQDDSGNEEVITEEDMDMFKEKVLSMNKSPVRNDNIEPMLSKATVSLEKGESQVVEKMERVQEFRREALDDITEESEKISSSRSADVIRNDDTTNDFDSIISLNMIQILENKVKELEEVVSVKDTSLNSLNTQLLDASQRRELFANKGEHDSLKDIPPSGRESTSLVTTTSTEYRTIQEDLGNKMLDFHFEISQKNNVIEKLTDSLQQSMKIREQLQQQSDQLSLEVQQLRKQLTETIDAIRKPYWPRGDQESSTGGQRLSEISIDLVSESDEDLDRQILIDEERISTNSTRNSKERQLGEGGSEIYDPPDNQITKQIEQFQKYLNPDELRIFFMVQKKFDDLLCQEIEKSRMKFDSELKNLNEQVEIEKHEKDLEINRLRQLLSNVKSGSTELIELRQELEAIHSHEMEKLRMYFEKKCADLEKQYSEEVFSQKSARDDSINSGSDISEQENLSGENQNIVSTEGNCRKKTRKELYASPSHRQITPGTDTDTEKDREVGITINDLKTFYQEKIHDIKKNYEEIIKRQNEKIKLYEARHADDDFMRKSLRHPIKSEDELGQGATSSYIIIDEDEAINESQEIRTIAAEYERRLQEQIALAKEDILHELENQIQVLLSETTTDDHHWPPELILLREKFTAKSQLEIAQLQIKHEEEMSQLKSDYEKQLNRKFKRNSTFDLSRDLDQIVNEKENLRELSSTFRWILCELAKYVTISEDDFNSTFIEELNNLVTSPQKSADNENQSNANISQQSNQLLQMNTSKRSKFVPNVSGLLSVIDDPELIEFVTNDKCETSFNLKDCLDKLKFEANYLLELSENLNKRNKEDEVGVEKNDSCEEEDGLKSGINRTPKKVARASSFNENVLRRQSQDKNNQLHEGRNIVFSLPPNFQILQNSSQFPVNEDIPTNEITLQVNELKNHLMKSENDRKKLQEELKAVIKRNDELGQELNALREQLDSQKEEYSEGYAIGQIKSPQRVRTPTNSFCQLQEKARNILSTPTKNMTENSQVLLQMIEEFCREGDKVVDDGKKEKEDLQLQIDAADKQLKSIRQFLDDQATERELERDEFIKEIEKLKNQIKDKEKERTSFEVASKEMEQMDQQIKELNQQIRESDAKKDKLEIELKASIDKIFVLREIISELETQVETKSLNEHVLTEKVKELEMFIASQTRSNENLQSQIENLKEEIGREYQEKITNLEDQLKNIRLGGEQSATWNQITEQLRDIEITLEQKIKNLESLHHSVCSTSCSTSPVEDVSVQGQIKGKLTIPSPPQSSPINISPRSLLLHSIPTDEVQRVHEKLSKHTRVEEAAIKRIKDLEMQVANVRTNFSELQHERDVLQEKMSEQLQRISVLQTKLDEQRHRAEELQRHGTSDLTIRIHDLQNEIHTLKETLSVRDKQIANLKKQLEQSKLIIERQEAELAIGMQSDRSTLNKLESELKTKTDENKKLKEKMKTEMINKLALPDLMETMLADKNEEIDHLKEQLESKEKELKGILEINLNQSNSASDDKKKDKSKASSIEDIEEGNKLSARTLSDIHSISEYDEPEAIRRTAVENASSLVLPQFPEQIMDLSKQTLEVVNEVSMTKAPSYEAPHYFQHSSFLKDDRSKNTPSPIPRRINFSEFSQEDTKNKGSASKVEEESIESDEIKILNARLKAAEDKVESLKISNETIENEKNDEIDQLKLNLIKKTELYESLCEERDRLISQKQELIEKLEMYSKLKSELEEKEMGILSLQNKFSVIEQELNKVECELGKKSSELEDLLQKNNDLSIKNKKLEEEIADLKSNSKEQASKFEHQIDTLQGVIQEKDEILSKQEKNLSNLQKNEKSLLEKIKKLEMEIQTMKAMSDTDDAVQDELNQVRVELSQKMMLHEKCLLDIQAYQKEIEMLKTENKNKDMIIASFGSSGDSKSLQELIADIQLRLENNENLNEIKNNLQEEKQRNNELEQRNSILENELEKLRSQNAISTSTDNSKPYSVDEIAEQVEKELNYSAQLDSNILQAMINNEDVKNLNLKTDHEKLIERDLLIQIQLLKNNLETETKQTTVIQQALNEEKKRSQEIQQQDAEIIKALRIRLEDALQKEEEFHKILDEEREKCERLSTQIAVLQRSEARKANVQLKSPPDSPRKQPREFDFELNERLKTEIKLLTAQNERERERVTDLQRVLEREKIRFETELSDRINYAQKLKKEMEKITHEKDLAENQVEHLEERLSLALKEIESLETRISTLQEAETRRAHRRGKERIENTQNAVELQELKIKIISLEAERDSLNQTIALLRSDIEKSAQRETKLAEALASSCGETAVPQQFVQKLKEMNCLLVENTKENRHMTETLQYLTDERRTLQKKIEELEMINQNSVAMAKNLMEMEERANHLFGRYLRVESHRKALVHQKRYLLIVLQTYQENEMKTLALLNVNVPSKPKKKLFKSVALAVIAIQRMKFIVRRWQTGKRTVAKSIFHFQAQKRSTLPIVNSGQPVSTSTSPPCRDKFATMNSRLNYLENPFKPLNAPGLISDFPVQKTDWIQWKK